MSNKSIQCPKCFENLTVDLNREFCFCEFCGEKIELSSYSGVDKDEKKEQHVGEYIIGDTVTSNKMNSKLAENKQDVLAYLSCVFGVLSILFLCCCVGWMFGIVGLAVGIIALKKKQKMSLCIVGISLSSVAIIISLALGVLNIMPQNSTTDSSTAYSPTADVLTTEEITTEAVKYNVGISVYCRENLLFNKYDIVVYVDNNKVGVLDHGANDTYDIKLEEGTYEVRFEKEDDSSVDGTIKIAVSNDTKVKYEIRCESEQVLIETTESILIPISNEDLGEIKVKDVIKQFEDAGFTNVEKKSLKDLDGDELKKKSIATEISIDGDTNVSKENTYFTDSEIIVSYHSAKEVNVGVDSYDLKGQAFEEVKKVFENKGFVQIKTDSEATGDRSLENQVAKVTIKDDETFYEDDVVPIDSEINITYYVFDSSMTTEEITTEEIQETESNDDSDFSSGTSSSGSYDKYDAQIDFENYCEAIYKYGIKLHWFMDCRASEEREDGTYYFKVGATITNAFGAKYKTVVEGVVDSNGNVISFYESSY